MNKANKEPFYRKGNKSRLRLSVKRKKRKLFPKKKKELKAGELNEEMVSLPMDASETCIYKEEEDDPLNEEDLSLEEHYSAPRVNTDEASTSKGFQKPDDEYDAIGYNVASKLRAMNKQQRIFAERIIAETLFQGQMGILTVNSSCSSFYPIIPALSNGEIKIDPDSLPL